MSLYNYAKSELDRIPKDKEGMQELVNQQILEIVKCFSEQGHSGFSGGYVISTLERLLKFKPLSSITDDPAEWEFSYKNGGISVFQNNRCSSVFMKKDACGNILEITDHDATLVSDNGGITWFHSNRFKKKIKLPYLPPTTPERIYIEYIKEVPPGFTGDEYEVITDQPDRISALYSRKRKEFDENQGEE